jgi:hypothetical protein
VLGEGTNDALTDAVEEPVRDCDGDGDGGGVLEGDAPNDSDAVRVDDGPSDDDAVALGDLVGLGVGTLSALYVSCTSNRTSDDVAAHWCTSTATSFMPSTSTPAGIVYGRYTPSSLPDKHLAAHADKTRK